MVMYTTTCTRLIRTNSLVLLELAIILLVVSVRLVSLGFTRLVTFITLVTLVTLPLIPFLRILEIGINMLCKHLTLRERWLLGLSMHGRGQWLMLEELECSAVHKEEKQFGRQVGAQETCC